MSLLSAINSFGQLRSRSAANSFLAIQFLYCPYSRVTTNMYFAKFLPSYFLRTYKFFSHFLQNYCFKVCFNKVFHVLKKASIHRVTFFEKIGLGGFGVFRFSSGSVPMRLRFGPLLASTLFCNLYYNGFFFFPVPRITGG